MRNPVNTALCAAALCCVWACPDRPHQPLALPVVDVAPHSSQCPWLPVGPPDGRGYYVAQAFGDNDHLGEDWNGNGGGNSDLGDPVVAIADGTVSSARDHGGGWGPTVRIVHLLPDGVVEAVYAHLDTMTVREGAAVERGQRIGTIGNVGGKYLAHLHFEIRTRVGEPLGPGYSEAPGAHFVDPRRFLEQQRRRCQPDR